MLENTVLKLFLLWFLSGKFWSIYNVQLMCPHTTHWWSVGPMISSYPVCHASELHIQTALGDVDCCHEVHWGMHVQILLVSLLIASTNLMSFPPVVIVDPTGALEMSHWRHSELQQNDRWRFGSPSLQYSSCAYQEEWAHMSFHSILLFS